MPGIWTELKATPRRSWHPHTLMPYLGVNEGDIMSPCPLANAAWREAHALLGEVLHTGLEIIHPQP